MKLVRLTSERFDETVDAFCDAFRAYPVMRYVLGEAGNEDSGHEGAGHEYDRRLRELVAYFTEARFSRQYPVLGIESDDGRIVAAANINPPRSLPAPPSLKRTFENLCDSLGPEAIARYEAFATACNPFEPETPHYHLGMIGVTHAAQGRGHARTLLRALHEMSRDDPESNGVSLTTETPRNLPFYEHFGYRILGRGETPDGGLVTWTFFRSDDAANQTKAARGASSALLGLISRS